MTNFRGSFSFILLVGTLLLGAVSTNPTEEADAVLFAPSPEPNLDSTLSPSYFPTTPGSDSPDADSGEAEPLSLAPIYAPENTPSLGIDAGSPSELSLEGSAPEMASALSPYPETYPADSETTDPSMSLPFPSMAPAMDDNDPGASYDPAPSSYSESYQSSSNADEAAEESYTTRYGKDRGGVMFGIVGAVCLVGLGGFVYLKRRENHATKSKYDQYLELTKKDTV